MVLRTVLLLATSITIAAAALLLALPLAQALPLQRGSFTFIPPYIHNVMFSRYSMCKLVRPFYFPELYWVFRHIPPLKIQIFTFYKQFLKSSKR